METGYFSIIPIKCDCCGKMVEGYSDMSEWWGKYLKPDEKKICHDCIKGRDGYAKEFRDKAGVDIQLTPKHCQCWSCKANREWRKPIEAEADAIWEAGSEETRRALANGQGITFPNAQEAIDWLIGEDKAMEEGYKAMATCTCHIDDGPACPVHSVRDDVCPACDGTGRLPYGHGFTCETDGQQGE